MERQGAVVWCGTGGVLVMKYILFVFIGFAMFILPYTGDAAIIGAKAETHRSDYMSMQVNRNIPSGAKKYAGHYYFVYANICNTWEAAEKYCESIGGHLAVINDYEENKMVYDIMKEFGYKSAYFGLSDAGHQDDWR
ncbi:C-type lectin domain-containing protein [Anaerovibrio sp.]|uniref:C-type lectin domain-containing protein n=1 Tax=Anaerovibrio sp. TaxID=1872532 RepID=UPI0025BF6FE7|nr:C-type lectin domain-containing protein [Anaerovibrio sp.]MBR2143106.1 C-type lectin domain-containing protein [Anaerovibrio sp.]